MKFNLYERATNLLQELLAVDTNHCSLPDNCPAGKMREMVETAFSSAIAEHAQPFSYENDFKFLKAMTVVQEDGRSCPAGDIHRQLLKLSNNKWKDDIFIIEIGIKTGVIYFERGDRIIEQPTQE